MTPAIALGAAMALLAVGGVAPAHAQTAALPVAPLRLALPGESWALELPAPDFAIAQLETSGDRQRYVLALARSGGFTLSVFVERLAEGTSAVACRDHYWASLQARSPLKMEDVRLGATPDAAAGETATLEYTVREVQGVRVDQKHLNRYLARPGVCVDVHVSKVSAVPADDDLLRGLAGAAALVAREAGVSAPDRRRFAVSDKQSVTIEIPGGWEPAFPRPARGRQPTLVAAAVGHSGANVQVSFIAGRALEAGTDVARALRAAVEQSGRSPLARAVETGLTVEELGGDMPGYFYRLTDRAPGPTGFRYLLQGIAMMGDVMITFTVLSHARDIPEIPAALAMIRSTRVE